MPLLECRNLYKVFPTSHGPLTVLREVSLEVQNAEVCVVRGRSGAGKSTLVSLLAGLDVPTGGSVSLEGQGYGGLRPQELAALRRTRLGVVFQAFNLIESLTALENVNTSLHRSGLSRAERRRRCAELLAELRIFDGDLFPSQLSQGQQQRVAIARALIGNPLLVLADEPAAQLDPETGAAAVRVLLDGVRRRGSALLVATHGGESTASVVEAADGRYELREGKLVHA